MNISTTVSLVSKSMGIFQSIHYDSPTEGVSRKVIDFNQLIPSTVNHPSARIYVRDAYPAYYDYIHQAFDSGYLLITLKGPSGIGTSYFYSYFFDRFRGENRDVAIVTAAFTSRLHLRSCRVFPLVQ